ncbi:MAG: crotonase/enoyl-CoA hydratase family protein [Acidocella sp.]|nr:crotonase/enoyl-CoA hydratase family protein [Acidocella sp.]
MARFLKSTTAITFEVAGAVAHVTLNRPQTHNALTMQMLDELNQAFLEADARTDVNVILLAGAGKSFCAGYDLGDAYSGKEVTAEGEEIPYRSTAASIDDDCWSMEGMQRKLGVIFQIHKPVVAKLHGNCLAGGTDIALACDIVVAAEDCKIGFPATRANGTPPANMWLYHCGPQWAKRLLFTGDTILGRDAARIGLVMDAYPAGELDAAAEALAARIALVDADLLSAHKRVINLGLELAGAQTLQRLATELDARAHLSRGPRRVRFREDMAQSGLREALKNRDSDFGNSVVTLNWAGK